MNLIHRGLLLAVAVGASIWSPAQAQYTFSTLASFDGANGSASFSSLVADGQGNLYGTTESGGTNAFGTVFEVAAGTHALTNLISFSGANGQYPLAGLVADAQGNFYGTTYMGGANGYGEVFEIAAGTHNFSVVASFDRLTNGASPHAGLIVDASGNLFGATSLGGSQQSGSIFEIAAGTHTISTLASFTGANGSQPDATLVADASGNLYGTTYEGGTSGDGTVFELPAGAHTISALVSFSGSNGENPEAGLVLDPNGNLYGTTTQGGANHDGIVFEVTAGAHALSTLVTFNKTNGKEPNAGLAMDASGNLFGATVSGGIEDRGTVFELTSGSHTFNTVLTFDGVNGENPAATLLIDANGNLYGTTNQGAPAGSGEVFGLVKQTPEPSAIVLALLGVAGIAALRWRLQKR